MIDVDMTTSRDTTDGTAEAIIGFLQSEGAADRPHAAGRPLLAHLVETYSVVRRWEQPTWLQHAALIHSVYGTDAYEQQLVPLSRRNDVAAVAGDRAERLAYLFCVVPRGPLLAGTHLWARDLPTLSTSEDATRADPPTRDELDAVVLLHMANLAEQAQSADGSPGRWLVKLRELAELLADSDAVTPPLFIARLAEFSEADESRTRSTYLTALDRVDDPEASASRLALAATLCSVVAEPCVWQAHLSRCRGDRNSCRSWARQARERLALLGTAWDKRMTFGQWLAIVENLERPQERDQTAAAPTASHPRLLLESVARTNARAREAPPALAQEPSVPPDAASARDRFHRYLEMLADAGGPGSGIYPDLPSRPWHEPKDFPLVGYLESHYATIRDEILALQSAQFHRESEGISRAGDWDVAFLYERGRRHDEVCAMCPTTTTGIEAFPTIRTSSGLIYVSRLRPSTHIAAHRGPTNLRLRCHLAVKVPEGDCAIRVGEETRRWQEGKCLVFDDSFDHEAWNHTEEDRVVLIIDLWHPGLSATERVLLEGVQKHTYQQAQRLSRYWSGNAAVRGNQDGTAQT